MNFFYNLIYCRYQKNTIIEMITIIKRCRVFILMRHILEYVLNFVCVFFESDLLSIYIRRFWNPYRPWPRFLQQFLITIQIYTKLGLWYPFCRRTGSACGNYWFYAWFVRPHGNFFRLLILKMTDLKNVFSCFFD